MTRPQSLKTRIFLDSGDPQETGETLRLLGFLDGQTTNPTLISKNPSAQKRLQEGRKFSKEEIWDFYQTVVKECSSIIPDGSVSLEVYADATTTAADMFSQGKTMFSWIPNAHIKYPTTHAGLSAARQSIKKGIRVNMTLCFTQEQAAAVYAATKGAKRGDVFVSPFVGRLDDKGENGTDLIANILRMYRQGDGHVEVLAASVRSIAHFMQALALGSEIITAPFSVLKEWSEQGLPLPRENFAYETTSLAPIAYQKINLAKNWEKYDLKHELTDKGIERFANDWKSILE